MTPRRDKPAILRYGMSVLAVAAALYIVSRMEPPPIAVVPASLLYCAILFSAWIGGLGPGLLAIAISFLGINYFVIAPHHSFAVVPAGLHRLAIFLVTAAFIGGLGIAQRAAIKSGRRARDELAQAMQELQRINLALELENTERKQVHEQLRLSEAFLTEGQKISHTGSWLWEISTGKLTWSDEQYRIFGFEPSMEAPGPCSDLIAQYIHPEDFPELQRVVKTALLEQNRFECEYRIVLPDGRIKYVQGVGCPVLSESGTINEYIGTTVDITARRKTENCLRKREQEFQSLAENVPDGIIRYNLDGERIYVNPAYERQSGLSANKALNRPLSDNWLADFPLKTYLNILGEVIQTGTPHKISGVWKKSDGKRIHFEVNVAAERNQNGDIVGALAITRDITSLKETEQYLEESRHIIRRLADQNETAREEERKHLARELHDDLTQYLLALRMRISLLDIEFGSHTPGLKDKTDGMIDLVDAAVKVVRNVVTTLRPAALDLGIVSALEWLVDEFTVHTGLRCKLRIGVDDIRLSEKGAIAIFRTAQESLNNAARHANAGKVEVAFRQTATDYIIEVTDDGKGFDPAEKKAKSFGLIGIHERILMLGGKVDITTAPHKGT
ncbi:MAG: sensory box histidine kinase, partial [Herbaspirillum sp.]|nr:sensory box histidine kinase [Herbaspirillum sp.]